MSTDVAGPDGSALSDGLGAWLPIETAPRGSGAAVYESAMNHAKKAGLDIAASLMNLGIEAALQVVRGKAQ